VGDLPGLGSRPRGTLSRRGAVWTDLWSRVEGRLEIGDASALSLSDFPRGQGWRRPPETSPH
jgi:hypothetical protein